MDFRPARMILSSLMHSSITKIDTEGLVFEPVLEDVETLNQGALEGKLDITKLSFPAFFQSIEHYTLLDAGSALGKGVGPLLVSKEKMDVSALSRSHTIALPGANTTANLVFSFAYPSLQQKKFMRFSEIEDAVLNGEADLGVIIHENRFTYEQKGLHKVADLGEYWENTMKTPIPLGGIAIKQEIKRSTALKVNALIVKSLQHAFAQYPQVSDYVKSHSQSMSEEVMRKHIDLYVNDYSLSLGKVGKKAILTMYATYEEFNSSNADVSVEELFL